MSAPPPSSSDSRPGNTHERDVIIIRIPQDARLSPSVMQFLAGLTTSQGDYPHDSAWPFMSPPSTSPSDEGQSSRWQAHRLPAQITSMSAIRCDETRSAPSSPRGEGSVQEDSDCAPAPAAHTTAGPRARDSIRRIMKAMDCLRVPGEPRRDSSDTSSILSGIARRWQPDISVPRLNDQSNSRVVDDPKLHTTGRRESFRASTPSSPLDDDFAELLRLERLPTPPARLRAISIRLPSRCPERGRHRCARFTG